jgi:hypothetical protein
MLYVKLLSVTIGILTVATGIVVLLSLSTTIGVILIVVGSVLAGATSCIGYQNNTRPEINGNNIAMFVDEVIQNTETDSMSNRVSLTNNYKHQIRERIQYFFNR